MVITPDVSLSYENEMRQSIEFNYFSTFMVLNADEAISNSVHSIKQPGVHGEFYTGMSLDKKHITLRGEVRSDMNLETAQRMLGNVFNPTIKGVLRYKHLRQHSEKIIECKLSNLPRVFWRRRRLQFTIELVCTDPFWKGAAVTEVIAETTGKLAFPIMIPIGGMAFAKRLATLETAFENAGNVEGGFTATIRARTGTVTNPELRNIITGERLRVLHTMQPDDEITIVSTLQQRRVLLNGENIFRLLDVEVSTFFSIAIGRNVIGYFADNNIGNMLVSVHYVPNFTFMAG